MSTKTETETKRTPGGKWTAIKNPERGDTMLVMRDGRHFATIMDQDRFDEESRDYMLRACNSFDAMREAIIETICDLGADEFGGEPKCLADLRAALALADGHGEKGGE